MKWLRSFGYGSRAAIDRVVKRLISCQATISGDHKADYVGSVYKRRLLVEIGRIVGPRLERVKEIRGRVDVVG